MDFEEPVLSSLATKGLTLTAMDKIEALVASTGATFWIEHDAALFQTLSLAPDYYR